MGCLLAAGYLHLCLLELENKDPGLGRDPCLAMRKEAASQVLRSCTGSATPVREGFCFLFVNMGFKRQLQCSCKEVWRVVVKWKKLLGKISGSWEGRQKVRLTDKGDFLVLLGILGRRFA